MLISLVVSIGVIAGCGDDDAVETSTPVETTAPATTSTDSDEVTTTDGAAPPESAATTTAAADCSAAGLPLPTDQAGLPVEVAETRTAVAAAAAGCDFEALSALAGPDFGLPTETTSDAGSVFRSWEAEGGSPLKVLVGLLDSPFGMSDDGHYVWPSAYTYAGWFDAPEEERNAIRSLVGENAFAFFANADAYSGPRLGITPSGDWTYYHYGETPTGGPTQCSASDITTPLTDQPDLPEPVVATREEIASLAVACDFVALGELGLTTPDFTYSFGSVGDPAAYWASGFLQGDEPMRLLVSILDLPFTTSETDGVDVYTWPSAAGMPWSAVPDDEKEAVLSLLGSEYEELFELEDAYMGPRTSISETGGWLFYVSGD